MNSVEQIEVPADARSISTLARVDYDDAFRLATERAQERTGEEWARAVLEGAPAATRDALTAGWSALGMERGSARDEELVLGWDIRRTTPEFALLGARSALGFEGEVLFKRERRALVFATFIELRTADARTVWAGVAPRHRAVVRQLLERVS